MESPASLGELSLFPLDARCTLLTNMIWEPDASGTPTLERQHLWVRFPQPLTVSGLRAVFAQPVGRVVVETAEDADGRRWRQLACEEMIASPHQLHWRPTRLDNLRLRVVETVAPHFPLGYNFVSLLLQGDAHEIAALEQPAVTRRSQPLTEIATGEIEPFSGQSNVHREERLGLCHEFAQDDRLEQLETDETITFASPLFQITFDRRHAHLTHLGWDMRGKGRAASNLLCSGHTRGAFPVVMRDGLRLSSESCGGKIAHSGRRISYSGIRPVPELCLDYDFSLNALGMTLDIRWQCAQTFRTSELAALRLPLDLYRTVTNVLAMPNTSGPSGLIDLPLLLNAPNHGVMRLTVEPDRDDGPVLARITPLRSCGELWLDLMPGARALPNGLIEMPAGYGHVTLRFALTRVFPLGNRDQSNYFGWWEHPPSYSFADRDNVLGGLPHAWLTGLAFRPDLGRFANNAVADSAAACAGYYADIAAYTPSLADGLDPRQFIRFAAEQLLRDYDSAAVYSDWRHFPMATSAPLDCAWLYVAAGGDWAWAERRREAIARFGRRLLQSEFEDSGLVISEHSGIPEEAAYMSASWCDSLRSGHLESYVNAHIYRALGRAAELLERLGDEETATACREMAGRLREHFLPTFLDEEGLEIVQWVARDGRRFSFDSHMHLGAAVALGLVPEPLAHTLLTAYLQRLAAHGPASYALGLPIFLRPVPAVCHNGWMGQGIEADGSDQVGVYMNGALHTHQLYYLLQALYRNGLRHEANAIMAALTPSLREGRLCGGLHSGLDWRHPTDGEPSGYEGLLAEQFHFLLAGITGYLGCALTLDGLYIPPWASERARGLLPHIRRAPGSSA